MLENPMEAGPVVEIVLFRLKEGIRHEDFLQAADALMLDLRRISGYIKRELLCDASGQWVDLVYWRSLDEALAAAEQFNTLPSARPFNAMIEPPSRMLHVQRLRHYDG